MKKTKEITAGANELSVEELQDAARMLRLLAHPYRLKIIDLLENKKDGLPVHALTEKLYIAQSAVSQHLTSLQRAGLLQGTRHGKEVWYKINDNKPLHILNCIRSRSNDS